MYRLLLDEECTIELEDIKEYDSSVYNSLKYIRDNDISEDENLEFYYSHEFNGKMYPLVPEGESIKVTDDNKESYITLKIDFMIKAFITDQINAIKRGFEKLISIKYLDEFSDKEFAYLCWGEDEINIEDWKNNTVYSGAFSKDHYLIKWFWKYMEELDQSSLSVIFQFVTGMSRLPAGGFNSLNLNRGEKQYFNIRSVSYNSKDPYPKAFTCFNRLHLPVYPTEKELKMYMNALVNQKEVYGFGLED